MFDKILYFDMAKLNWIGWLLFLLTTALFLAACFLIAFQAEEVADVALENRATKKITGVVMMGIAVVFFVGVRIVLEKLGISIHRTSQD